jgi:hypothetical protein
MLLYLHHITQPYCSNDFKFLKLRPQLFTHVIYLTAFEIVDVFKISDTKVNDVFLMVSFIKLNEGASAFRRKILHPELRVLN